MSDNQPHTSDLIEHHIEEQPLVLFVPFGEMRRNGFLPPTSEKILKESVKSFLEEKIGVQVKIRTNSILILNEEKYKSIDMAVIPVMSPLGNKEKFEIVSLLEDPTQEETDRCVNLGQYSCPLRILPRLLVELEDEHEKIKNYHASLTSSFSSGGILTIRSCVRFFPMKEYKKFSYAVVSVLGFRNERNQCEQPSVLSFFDQRLGNLIQGIGIGNVVPLETLRFQYLYYSFFRCFRFVVERNPLNTELMEKVKSTEEKLKESEQELSKAKESLKNAVDDLCFMYEYGEELKKRNSEYRETLEELEDRDIFEKKEQEEREESLKVEIVDLKQKYNEKNEQLGKNQNTIIRIQEEFKSEKSKLISDHKEKIEMLERRHSEEMTAKMEAEKMKKSELEWRVKMLEKKLEKYEESEIKQMELRAKLQQESLRLKFEKEILEEKLDKKKADLESEQEMYRNLKNDKVKLGDDLLEVKNLLRNEKESVSHHKKKIEELEEDKKKFKKLEAELNKEVEEKTNQYEKKLQEMREKRDLSIEEEKRKNVELIEEVKSKFLRDRQNAVHELQTDYIVRERKLGNKVSSLEDRIEELDRNLTKEKISSKELKEDKQSLIDRIDNLIKREEMTDRLMHRILLESYKIEESQVEILEKIYPPKGHNERKYQSRVNIGVYSYYEENEEEESEGEEEQQGEVLLVRNKKPKQQRKLKKIPVCVKTIEFQADIKEVVAMARLVKEGEPIVKLYGYFRKREMFRGSQREVVKIVMSKHDMDLHDYVKFYPVNRRRQLSRLQKIMLVRKMAESVCYLNEWSVVHRDIKPGNFLVQILPPPPTSAQQSSSSSSLLSTSPEKNSFWNTRKKRHEEEVNVLLTDFGLVRFLSGGRSVITSYSKGGTPFFRAPEVYKGGRKAFRPATDIWALGRSFNFVWNNGRIYGEDVGMMGSEKEYNMSCPRFTDQEMLEKLQCMLSYRPKDRPKIENVLSILEKMEYDEWCKVNSVRTPSMSSNDDRTSREKRSTTLTSTVSATTSESSEATSSPPRSSSSDMKEYDDILKSDDHF